MKKNKIELNVKNLENALTNNKEKILIVEVPIGNTPPDMVDEYMENTIKVFKSLHNLEEYQILYIPYRNPKEKVKITSIQEQSLNNQGWFKESK